MKRPRAFTSWLTYKVRIMAKTGWSGAQFDEILGHLSMEQMDDMWRTVFAKKKP